MKGERRATIALLTKDDIVRARQEGRALARIEGLQTADQTRLATAISELTRNVILYAHDGQCELFVDRAEIGFLTIGAVVSDQGPGIADLGRAMMPGFSTGNGLGAGLPGVKRLMDRFTIDSSPAGTRVTVAIRRRIG